MAIAPMGALTPQGRFKTTQKCMRVCSHLLCSSATAYVHLRHLFDVACYPGATHLRFPPLS